jgi:hypothetical protein
MLLVGIGRNHRAGKIETEYAVCAAATYRSRRIQSRTLLEFERKHFLREFTKACHSFRRAVSREVIKIR